MAGNITSRQAGLSRAKALLGRLDKSLIRLLPDQLPDPAFSPRRHEVTSRLLKALRNAGLTPPSLQPAATADVRLAKWLSTIPNDVLRPLGFDRRMPPHGIHIVSAAWNMPFDMRNCDIMEDALHDAGLSFKARASYLDFGCSSGRTVRTFALAYPKSRWTGCDPVPSSIKWAAASFPAVTFLVNDKNPPTSFPAASFDGVYAKSIWTHFGDAAAVDWMAEMARIVKPGGFMLFTAHGHHDLARRIIYSNPAPNYSRLADVRGDELDVLETMVEELTAAGVFFRPYKNGLDSQARTAEKKQWGLTFMTPDWVKRQLVPIGWTFKHHAIGRTGLRQDAYVLQRV